MRVSSTEYRAWTLEAWCAHVRALGVSTLSDWAQVSRSSYNHAVTLGRQREVARKLGWLPKLEKDEMESMSDDEFLDRFRAKGVRNITDMWRSAQHYCEFLRREGRLEALANRLGFGYLLEFHPSDDVEYYVERCRRAGDFTVWCLLDRRAAEAARKHGLIRQVRERSPNRPRRGYPSQGGYCKSLAELAVARLLEANAEPFITGLDYPFTFPRGTRQRCKADFFLAGFGAYVEVWAVFPDDTSTFWDEYQLRRRFKVAACRQMNLRLLHVEGQILFQHGAEAYLRHVAAVLSAAGLRLNVDLDSWSALAPQYAEQVVSNGS